MMPGMIALFVRHEVPNLSAVAWHHQDGSVLLAVNTKCHEGFTYKWGSGNRRWGLCA